MWKLFHNSKSVKMRTLRLISIGFILFFAGVSQAQVSVNVKIGSPPTWGPVGYTEVNYYYLPDVEAYYDVPASMFIYYGEGVWVHRSYLPSRYRNYDLYGGYKVVMTDYRGHAPYMHFKDHKMKYEEATMGKHKGRSGRGRGKAIMIINKVAR